MELDLFLNQMNIFRVDLMCAFRADRTRYLFSNESSYSISYLLMSHPKVEPGESKRSGFDSYKIHTVRSETLR